MSVKESFATRLKYLRECCNLTQAELASVLNISRGSLSFYENGERTPDIEILDKVIDLFSVPADYLLGYVDTTHQENVDINLYLGLSDKAIYTMKEENINQEILSKLIENDIFCSMLDDINSYLERYRDLSNILKIILKIKSSEFDEYGIDQYQLVNFYPTDNIYTQSGKEFLNYKIVRSFEKVLNSLVQEFEEKESEKNHKEYSKEELQKILDESLIKSNEIIDKLDKIKKENKKETEDSSKKYFDNLSPTLKKIYIARKENKY